MGRPTVREDLRALEGYHSPQLDVTVRLNTNEAPAAPPSAFSAAVAAAAERIEWHRYPDRGATELRRRIAELHCVDGVIVDPSQVFVANGSNEVLQTVLLTFAGPGRTVATFEPTYALHQHITRLVGGVGVEGRRSEDFTLDPDEIRSVVADHRPSVTFLCSPNNPTGMVDDDELIDVALEAVDGVGGLLVVDEAYGQFNPTSAIGRIGDDVPLVVSRTYSKTWAMAGARLGYLLGPAWLIAELDKVVLPYHLDAMKQAAGIAALDFVADMDARVAAIVEERGRVSTALAELGCHVWPSGSNFVLFRPPAGNGAEVWQGLVDRSVLVRNTASWPGLDGCLRVTIGTADDNTSFLSALADTLADS